MPAEPTRLIRICDADGAPTPEFQAWAAEMLARSEAGELGTKVRRAGTLWRRRKAKKQKAAKAGRGAPR